MFVVFHLNPDRLYATFFEGNEDAPRDIEAQQYWLKYLPSERVIACSAKDNFWEMGATGPCGPCTEIHYDRIGNRCVPDLVNADLPDVIEIWNNVFIQFNRENDGSLRTLPDQHVDTGMGFERLTSILQNVDSNYDTDIFQPIFEAIQRSTGCEFAYQGLVGAEDAKNGYRDMAYRVVADHIRTLCFSIADGAAPSNDGRGYVLRRILRRAVRYGRQNLHATNVTFFSALVPTIVQLMGSAYPELVTQQDHIMSVIQSEEESFALTLDKGLARFDTILTTLQNDPENNSNGNNKIFPSSEVYKLYTTHGFPIDLTALMAEEHGYEVNESEVESLMEQERTLSKLALEAKRAAQLGDKDLSVTAEQTAYLSQELQLAATDDEAKYEIDSLASSSANILAIYHSRETGFVSEVSAEDGTVGIVLNQTPFYSESGGQVYDTGILTLNDSTTFVVSNVQCYAGYVLHLGSLSSNSDSNCRLSVGDTVICTPDLERRQATAANHTFTHVLNHALRSVLSAASATSADPSNDIQQKGSFVDDVKLRFDFSYNHGSIPVHALSSIESHCQTVIDRALPVYTTLAKLQEAKSIQTLRCVFGEVYPDNVRVVSVGVTYEDLLQNCDNEEMMQYSVEFCGGTHLRNCGDAKAFVLINEEGVAKGIRRITALTGNAAVSANTLALELTEKCHRLSDFVSNNDLVSLEEGIKSLTNALNDSEISAVTKSSLRDQLTSLSKTLVTKKKEEEKAMTQQILEEIKSSSAAAGVNNKYVHSISDFPVTNVKLAKSILTAFQKANPSVNLCLVLSSSSDKKILIASMSAKAKDAAVDCTVWLKSALEGLEGRGGGNKNAAQYTIEVSDGDALSSIAQSLYEKAQSC